MDLMGVYVYIYIAAGASNLNDLNDILFFLDFVLVKKHNKLGVMDHLFYSHII